MPKERSAYFDNLKGLLMFLVFTGHCLDTCRQIFVSADYLFALIYLFHMPLMFFVSGVFSKKERSVTELFDTLIFPALPFELLYFLIHWGLGMDNAHQFMTPIFAYWYVFVLFGFRSLLPLLKCVRGIIPLSFALAILIGLNSEIGQYMSLGRFFCMLPFFMMGYFADVDALPKIRMWNHFLGIGLISLSAAALAVYLQSTSSEVPFQLSTAYESVAGIVGRIFQFAFCIPIALGIMNLIPDKKCSLTQMGKNSLMVYFLHFYAVAIFDRLVGFLNSSLLSVLCCMIFSYMGTWFFSRNVFRQIYEWMLDRAKNAVFVTPD